jgi:hypothetical protein
MLYTIFVFVFGVYVGQEYSIISIRQLLTHVVNLIQKNERIQPNENFDGFFGANFESELFSSFTKTFRSKK